MIHQLDIQRASVGNETPSDDDFQNWVGEVLINQSEALELSIRIVDGEEITHLNHTYRSKNKTTNVLSFPADVPDYVDTPLLGDIIICAPVVCEEALQQHKTPQAHWAHMTIHGVLHLLGYDHIEEAEAEEMEALEIRLLANLGYDDPYQLLPDPPQARKS